MSIWNINDDFERLPGLFRAWDFGILLEEGRRYRVEDGGRTDDGEPLYMVFYRSTERRSSGTSHDF